MNELCDFRDPRFEICNMKGLVWGTATLPARCLRPQFRMEAFYLGLYSSVSQTASWTGGDSGKMNLGGAFDDTELQNGRVKCKIVFHSSSAHQGGGLNLVLMYFSNCLHCCSFPFFFFFLNKESRGNTIQLEFLRFVFKKHFIFMGGILWLPSI